MPAKQPEKVRLTCPHCGHSQLEPPAVISTVCKQCRRHYRVEDLKRAGSGVSQRPREVRHLACFECGTELEASLSAQSTMCKRCSAHIDLRDYIITNAVSRNFRTKGHFVVEPRGYVFNTETVAGDAVIKGRFLGKLTAERSLAIYTGAEIKGIFRAGLLVIPADNHFRWREPLQVGSAEVAGELVADLLCPGTVTLKSTARYYGLLEARGLIMEAGAVFEGYARVRAVRDEPSGRDGNDGKPRATDPPRT